MKRILLSTAAVALISGTSYAADLPVIEAPAPVIEATPVAQNWTGFYLGLHGGYGWGNVGHDGDGDFFDDDDDDDDDDDGDRRRRHRGDSDNDADVEGGVFGAQIGMNWQWDWFVLGAEADASAFFTEDDDNGFFDDDDDDDDDGIFDDDDGDDGDGDGDRRRRGRGRGGDDFGAEAYWLASARLRAGVGLDRVLLYGTGGVGFAEWESEWDGRRGRGDDNDGDVEIGWVAGGGAEFMLTDNVTIGAEYLHYEFGDIGDDDDDDDDDGGRRNRGGDNDFGDLDADVDVIRGRVNVKFSSLFGGR